MLNHAGDSQINKVIGENEKWVFYFTEKNIWTFWSTQYIVIDWRGAISICYNLCFFLKRMNN